MRGVKALIAAATAALAYAWWATQLRPFATTTTVAVMSGGVAAMALGARHAGRISPPRLRGTDAAVWVTLLAALAAWQLAAYLQHPRSEHPTLSSMANALTDSHTMRTLVFTLWLAGAARLARR